MNATATDTTDTALRFLKLVYEEVYSEWAPIENYPGYEVRRTGQVRNSSTGKLIAPRTFPSGLRHHLGKWSKGKGPKPSYSSPGGSQWPLTRSLVHQAFAVAQPGWLGTSYEPPVMAAKKLIINKAREALADHPDKLRLLESAMPAFLSWYIKETRGLL